MDYLAKQKSRFIAYYGAITFRMLQKAVRYRTPYGALPTLRELSRISGIGDERLRYWLRLGIFGQEVKSLLKFKI